MPSPNVSNYHIGIVCALPKELAAVLAILDEEYDQPSQRFAQDDNTYILGRIHKHNVVVVCLPAGNYGTESAATVANNLARTFANVRMGLMVGIGGGIPNLPEDDIRLGDVVISQPDGELGGVVQYDLRKHLEGGVFKRKGSLNQPPKALLTALSLSQAKHADISSYLQEAYLKHPTLMNRGYGSPGPENDRLYCAKDEVTREDRVHKSPVIHYGTIASGNSVIKDATFRDQLGRELGAKCVEMEAAGLMNNFPCIVVRGICDYADSHKNDKWQEYAALTAAASAKELLSWLLPEKTESIRLYENDEHMKCHQAFKTTTYENFKNINPERMPDTCQWALKHQTFHHWYENTNDDLLWISADPGCGKSVLARSLIDTDLHRDERVNVCYFFFKDNDAQNNLFAALCSLLHQLFTFAPHLIHHALPAWGKTGNLKKIEIDELWRILLAAVGDEQAPSVTCVLDALDECRKADRNVLIRNLVKFSKQNVSSRHHSPRQVKFLVTSRPYSEIEDEFQTIRDLPSIRLRGEHENKQIHKEINMVIQQRVNELATSLDLHQRTKDRLENQLLNMKHRTYLWLYLAIESIKDTFRDSFRPDEEVIELLPTGVEDAYEKILNKASKKRQDLKLILQIIVGAKRPLTIREMAIALGVATDRKNSNTLKNMILDENHLERHIRSWCGLFVFVSDSQIHLIHQTARDFLVRKPISAMYEGGWKYCLVPAEVEEALTDICVRVLLATDIMDVLCSLASRLEPMSVYADSDVSESSSDGLDPVVDQESHLESFIIYSVWNWTVHLSMACLPINPLLRSKILQLYDPDTPHFGWRLEIYRKSDFHSVDRSMNSLSFAAYWGHIEFVQAFLRDGRFAIDQLDARGNTALIHACRTGQEKIVSLLLEKGADIHVRGMYGNAFDLACKNGNVAVVGLLLDKGAGDLDEALRTALSYEKLVLANLLLHKGAPRGPELLLKVVKSWPRSADIVELLIREGADVNHVGVNQVTALEWASKHGIVELVKLLLNNGASDYDDALVAAAGSGYTEIVTIYLARGGSVDVRRHGEMSLRTASRKGNATLCEPLIDKGAECCGEALVLASWRGHIDVVRLLLRHGVGINGKYHCAEVVSRMAVTALEAASKAGRSHIVKTLLSEGAHCSEQAVLYAWEGDDANTIEILLDAGGGAKAVRESLSSDVHVAFDMAIEQGRQTLMDFWSAAQERRKGRRRKRMRAASTD